MLIKEEIDKITGRDEYGISDYKYFSDYNMFLETNIYKNIRIKNFSNEEFKFMFDYCIFNANNIMDKILSKVSYDFSVFFDLGLYNQFKRTACYDSFVQNGLIKTLKKPTIKQLEQLLELASTRGENKEILYDLDFFIRNIIKSYFYEDGGESADYNSLNEIYPMLYRYIDVTRKIYGFNNSYYYVPFSHKRKDDGIIVNNFQRLPYINFPFLKVLLDSQIDNKLLKINIVHYLMTRKRIEPARDIIKCIQYCKDTYDSVPKEELKQNSFAMIFQESMCNSDSFATFLKLTIYNESLSESDKNLIYKYYLKDTNPSEFYDCGYNLYITAVIQFLKTEKERDTFMSKILDVCGIETLYNFYQMNSDKRYTYPSEFMIKKINKVNDETLGFFSKHKYKLFTINQLKSPKFILNFIIKNRDDFDLCYKLLNGIRIQDIPMDRLELILTEVYNITRLNFFNYLKSQYMNKLSKEELYQFKSKLEPSKALQSQHCDLKMINYLIKKVEREHKTFSTSQFIGSNLFWGLEENKELSKLDMLSLIYNNDLSINLHLCSWDKSQTNNNTIISFTIPQLKNLTIEEVSKFYDEKGV